MARRSGKYDILWICLGYLGLSFFLAGAQYISGRIIFPEMGLKAPSFGAWFALTFFVETPFGIFQHLIKKIVDESRYPRIF